MRRKVIIALCSAILFYAGVAGAQGFNCPPGSFTSAAGSCQVTTGNSGGPGFWLGPNAEGSLSGTQAILLPSGANHEAATLMYQTVQNIQTFTANFQFIPNGQNISFVLNNSTGNEGNFNNGVFVAGAGCEAGWFQGFTPQTVPPANVFAMEFDSYSPDNNSQSFTGSNVQIYQSNVAGYPNVDVQCPCVGGSGICGNNNSDPSSATKINTTPVQLDSPATSQNTTTGHTYDANIVYDGSNFTLSMYDVTAGGSCPGSTCFTNTWTNVNIPNSVGGNTAWVGINGSSGSVVPNAPLVVNSFTFTPGTAPTPTPTPTATATPTPTPTACVCPTSTPTATPTPGPFEFSAPAQGASVSGTITVSVTNVPGGETYIKYLLPNAPVNATCSFGQYDNAWNGCSLYTGTSFTYDTTLVPNGTAGFQALFNGGLPSASLSVTVAN